MVDLDRIEALANAATPGPWEIDREEIDNEDGVLDGDILGCPRSIGPLALIDHESLDVDTVEADAAFIAAAREAVPALVAELRAARAEIERLRTAAADERADVVAWLMRQGWVIASNAINRGAHVGAAKGTT